MVEDVSSPLRIWQNTLLRFEAPQGRTERQVITCGGQTTVALVAPNVQNQAYREE